MKLTTIWTLKGLDFEERLKRTFDLILQKIAALLPKRLRYAVVIQELAWVTVHKLPSREVSSVTIQELLTNLRGGPK